MTACCLTWSYSSRVSGPGLCSSRSGIAEFADVVQRRRRMDRRYQLIVEADFLREGDAKTLDPEGVLRGGEVAGRHDPPQGIEHYPCGRSPPVRAVRLPARNRRLAVFRP